MQPFLVGAFAVVFIGGIIALAIWSQRRVAANLRALAGRLKLNVVTVKKALGATEQHVDGQWQGRHVRFWSYTTGAGKTRKHWVVVGAETPAGGGVEFELRAQGVLTKLSEFFGRKEIRVGDAAFDTEWFITTNRPVEFAAALVPEIREKISTVRRAGGHGTYLRREGWVCYVEPGSFFADAALKRLEQALPIVVDLADVVEVCAAGSRD